MISFRRVTFPHVSTTSCFNMGTVAAVSTLIDTMHRVHARALELLQLSIKRVRWRRRRRRHARACCNRRGAHFWSQMIRTVALSALGALASAAPVHSVPSSSSFPSTVTSDFLDEPNGSCQSCPACPPSKWPCKDVCCDPSVRYNFPAAPPSPLLYLMRLVAGLAEGRDVPWSQGRACHAVLQMWRPVVPLQRGCRCVLCAWLIRHLFPRCLI